VALRREGAGEDGPVEPRVVDDELRPCSLLTSRPTSSLHEGRLDLA
jgi:hypothetical protein